MAEKPSNKPDPNQWEEDFFKAHNISDENEKNAIRGRARVLAYDRARVKAESEQGKPSPDDKPKKWYDR